MENLDAMDLVDLHKFVNKTRGKQPRRAARLLFGTATDGRTAAVRDLNTYAWNLITARACRMRGDIQDAQRYEAICERIYSTLPDFARW